MKVFLGSSGSAESLDDLRKIAILIEEEGHTPVSWKKEGLFPLGNYMLDSLIEISKQVNAAVLIFNEDDPVWYRNEYVKQPRDNVSMEYTLFAATLG